jgi:hypothetical protein
MTPPLGGGLPQVFAKLFARASAKALGRFSGKVSPELFGKLLGKASGKASPKAFGRLFDNASGKRFAQQYDNTFARFRHRVTQAFPNPWGGPWCPQSYPPS